MTTGPARTRLRAATRDLHDRVEAMPRLARLRRPGLTLEQYADTLGRLHRFFAQCERQVTAGLGAAELAALEVRMKAPLLARDLARLGRDPPAVGDPGSPAAVTPGHTLGLLYVLEGSVLGGRVLEREVRGHLGPAVDDALAFYRCYEPDTAGHWRRFCAGLEARLAAEGPLAQAEAGAREAFAALLRHAA